MLKLAKYLKPYVFLIILTFILLFVQAICDLNLPNLMSDIINVGIQQGGIEKAVPEAMSDTARELLFENLNDAKRRELDSYYYKISVGDAAYAKKYPASQMSDIYIKRDTADDSRIEALIEQAAASLLPEAASLLPEAAAQKQAGIALTKSFYTSLGMDTARMQINNILLTGLKMLFISLLGVIAAVIVGFLSSRIAAEAVRTLRGDMFNKVGAFSGAEFDKFGAASLITRTTNDMTQLQMIVTIGLRMACMAPIMAIGGIIMALRQSLSMSWVIALAVIVLIGLVIIIFSLAMPKFKIIQKLVDKLNLVSRENLTGLMVIRAFGTQTHEKNRFDTANRELADVNLYINRITAFMMPAMMLIMNGVSLLIVWVGAKQIAASAMQVGDMMAFMQYAIQIIMSFLMMAMMFIMIPRAQVSAVRVAEVLGTEISILDPVSPKAFDVLKTGVVEFKNVSFKYGNAEEYVLKDISFTAKPGQTTAFIGSTGSGKSTLVNLIPRFYDVTEGQITVSGQDIREVTQHDLREQIGYIPQKGMLLSGTIDSNLRYGKQDVSEDELRLCTEIAQASDFILEKEDGYMSIIAEGGANVSGGQKQRLSIARALVKNAPVYIFDDSFSALDFKTDANLRRALLPYTKNSAVLIVAQRIGTIKHADQIIVLEHGKIAGTGTHSELLRNCPVYAEIASSQLSKEEL